MTTCTPTGRPPTRRSEILAKTVAAFLFLLAAAAPVAADTAGRKSCKASDRVERCEQEHRQAITIVLVTGLATFIAAAITLTFAEQRPWVAGMTAIALPAATLTYLLMMAWGYLATLGPSSW